MLFNCASCGVEDHHDGETCGHCGKSPVISPEVCERCRELGRETFEQSDLIERLQGERREWVQCSERLPDKLWGTYLVTVKYADWKAGVNIAVFWEGKWVRGLSAKMQVVNDVIAWRELPEPFKEND